MESQVSLVDLLAPFGSFRILFGPLKIDLFFRYSSRPGPKGAATAPTGDEEKLQPHLGSAT